MTVDNGTGSGKNRLFNDSKLGVIVTAAISAVLGGGLNGAIDALTKVDMSGGNSWWGPIIGSMVAAALGFLTAYKAKRDKGHNRL